MQKSFSGPFNLQREHCTPHVTHRLEALRSPDCPLLEAKILYIVWCIRKCPYIEVSYHFSEVPLYYVSMLTAHIRIEVVGEACFSVAVSRSKCVELQNHACDLDECFS